MLSIRPNVNSIPVQSRLITSRRSKFMKVNRIPKTYTKHAPSRTYKPNAINDVSDISYYVGKSIILFTLFYTSLNYFHYKQIRKDHENDNSNNKKPKQK